MEKQINKKQWGKSIKNKKNKSYKWNSERLKEEYKNPLDFMINVVDNWF